MGNFKKLKVWKESIELTKSIYLITNEAPFREDFGLKDQIRRACVSIASNIAEGSDQGSDGQAVRYFGFAKGSTAEVITQLNIAREIEYIENQIFTPLEDKTEKIRASIINLIKAYKT